ncbi:probable polygalacturonase At3g15720 [Neltuma alba]|uniref:probable polygalacturonase At3g15720 n=1 Tax=Neltuma alba TaxID=207710 RepID=UPI0010A4BD08|nr:probable polygalacturonase At3g15720 [Prosopis alba]
MEMTLNLKELVQHKSSAKDLKSKCKEIKERITPGDVNVKIQSLNGPPVNNPTFNVLDYAATANGQTNDSKSFLKAWKDVCEATQDSPTLLIPKNKTFMLQPVTFMGECKSSTINVKIEGRLIAPRGVIDWKWEGVKKGRWIHFSDIKGLLVNGRGLMDGQGAPWWDCFHESRCKRPDMALSFRRCENLQLKEPTHINSPAVHIHLDCCNGAYISNLNIVAPQERSNSTDGIDISTSSNIIIQDSNIETGDDCIAINKGSSLINITGVFCGPGHGISIGSLGPQGSHATVEDIHVRNCTFTRTSNGARIKTWKGGYGYARKITFEDITLVEARKPIIINQYYGGVDEVTAVEVSDITYRNFKGTSATENATQLVCDVNRDCTDIVLDQINITSSQPGKATYASCENAHGTSSSSNVPDTDCLKV